MKIDRFASRELFRKSGRRVATWARANGFDAYRMHHILSNNVVPKVEEMDALKRDGLVKFVDDDEDKAA